MERGAQLRASFEREAHFGALFRNASSRALHPRHPSGVVPSQVVRWVDSFEMHGGRELWLVFVDEGQALSTYATHASGLELGSGFGSSPFGLGKGQ